VLHFETERLTLTPEFDMETNVNNTTEPQHDAKLPVGSSALSDDEMDGSSEICEPERCLYCDMDGPWRNGLHVIGCPNGMLS